MVDLFLEKGFMYSFGMIGYSLIQGRFLGWRRSCRLRREKECERDFLEARIRSVAVIRSKQVSTGAKKRARGNDRRSRKRIRETEEERERGGRRGLIYLSTGSISP